MSRLFIIVDPLWVHRHKQTSKVQDILRRDMFEQDFVFIPYMVLGHWVLWTNLRHKVSKVTHVVVFCNPMNNEAIGTIKSLADIAIKTICSFKFVDF